jgi:hypothetical protein
MVCEEKLCTKIMTAILKVHPDDNPMYSITRYFTAEDFKEVGKCKKDVYMD